jgi:hypothetical protein
VHRAGLGVSRRHLGFLRRHLEIAASRGQRGIYVRCSSGKQHYRLPMRLVENLSFHHKVVQRAHELNSGSVPPDYLLKGLRACFRHSAPVNHFPSSTATVIIAPGRLLFCEARYLTLYLEERYRPVSSDAWRSVLDDLISREPPRPSESLTPTR